jgi:hypothetical protein
MENPILKKLNIKPGTTLFADQAPENVLAILGDIPAAIKMVYAEDQGFDAILLFATKADALLNRLTDIKKYLKPETIIWTVYPKKSSGIETDLSMMGPWDKLEALNLRPCASAAINASWTGIRLKPLDMVKLSGVAKESIKNNALGKFIDVDKKQVTLPPDLDVALRKYPQAYTFFESLSWSNKKEYVVWVLTAKQEKTRNARVIKTVDMLLQNKKNPTFQ